MAVTDQSHIPDVCALVDFHRYHSLVEGLRRECFGDRHFAWLNRLSGFEFCRAEVPENLLFETSLGSGSRSTLNGIREPGRPVTMRTGGGPTVKIPPKLLSKLSMLTHGILRAQLWGGTLSLEQLISFARTRKIAEQMSFRKFGRSEQTPGSLIRSDAS